MGEYEPRDSRNVTLRQKRAPGEPPRTGPRESETRQQQGQTELEQDERGEQAEQTVSVEQQQEQSGDEESGEADDPARFDRND